MENKKINSPQPSFVPYSSEDYEDAMKKGYDLEWYWDYQEYYELENRISPREVVRKYFREKRYENRKMQK